MTECFLLPKPGQSLRPPAVSREFVFTGDPGSMPAARDNIMDFIREYCSSEQEEIDIFLALQEALANAVLHGCQSDPGTTIHGRVEVGPSAITVVISDPGTGFDPTVVTACASEVPNLTGHGRGICLMRSLMDDVTYLRGGAEVRLTKLRSPISKV